MWAMMLSIRREGPELAEEKKTSRGWASSGKSAPVEGLSHYARQAATPKPLARCAFHLRPLASVRALMGDWYTVGILVGLGAAIGVAATGALRRALVGLVIAAACSVALGFAFGQWDEATGGAAGAICGALGSAPLVSGTLRRGGTRGGTATLLALASLAGAALAFVPVVGYLEALAVPVLGARLRRRAPDKHAGLRSLAKD
jgi:hypothetical protein